VINRDQYSEPIASDDEWDERTLVEIKNLLKNCDHLDEDLVQVYEYMDGFAWHCKKCNTTFSRYSYQPIREYQKRRNLRSEP